MLKIKDGIDLKKLEKYGFEYLEPKEELPHWEYVSEKEDFLLVYCDREVIGIDIEKTFELTKANLLEKVSIKWKKQVFENNKLRKKLKENRENERNKKYKKL